MLFSAPILRLIVQLYKVMADGYNNQKRKGGAEKIREKKRLQLQDAANQPGQRRIVTRTSSETNLHC